MITVLIESVNGQTPLTQTEIKEITNITRSLAKAELDNGYGIDYFLRTIDALRPYQSGTANKDNFFYNTIAIFTPCKRPKTSPSYQSKNRQGKVSSEYWYTSEGVVRGSDHWGTGVASCDWALKDITGNDEGSITKTRKRYGFCKWEDFILKPSILTTDDTNESFVTTFDNKVGKKDVEINGKLYGVDGNKLLLLYDPNKIKEPELEYSFNIDTIDLVNKLKRELKKNYQWFEDHIVLDYILYGDFPGDPRNLHIDDWSGDLTMKLDTEEDYQYWKDNFYNTFVDDLEHIYNKSIKN